jgi:hypothetical protein
VIQQPLREERGLLAAAGSKRTHIAKPEWDLKKINHVGLRRNSKSVIIAIERPVVSVFLTSEPAQNLTINVAPTLLETQIQIDIDAFTNPEGQRE